MDCRSPIISLVIPTYNCGHLIGEILGRALKQGLPLFESIAIDGGSTDNTTSNLTSYAGRLRISVVRTVGCSVQNRGVAAAYSEAVISSVEARHLDVFNGAFARRVRHGNTDVRFAALSTK